MNSGLPSLLDAIFGKNDLTSVSLDELYELINEFPSFNAGHFLLSKKLKEQNDSSFEGESMRTALYFHNAFWLQTLLDDGNNTAFQESLSGLEKGTEKNRFTNESVPETNIEINVPIDKGNSLANEWCDEVKEESNENILEQSLPMESTFDKNEDEANIVLEDDANRVMSFDDLISKYKIEFNEPIREIQTEKADASIDKSLENVSGETSHIEFIETQIEDTPDFSLEEKEEIVENSIDNLGSEQFETQEEIINEYGIFEEVAVGRHDHDLDAFDRPLDSIETNIETSTEPAVIEQITDIPDLESSEKEPEIENPIPEITPAKSDEDDYEAFDGFSEISPQEPIHTEKETQKPTIQFDAKNSESIVFAPYHVIDYFASQGIKLVLDDQPVDNFGKQLKSFTDWLKVMKKIPVSPLSAKVDEKETERIRHFAAHSIEERDILTESMAEVLAKQGMYENAIALYQKLSLIYPPKSAYFASRIEQLKATLP